MDVTVLSEAYDRFHEAADGEFEEPPDGGWGAELVLAHIAETSRSFADVTRALLEGRRPAYDNAESAFLPNLQRVVRETATLDALRSLSRSRGQELIDLAARLNEQQAATPVHSRIIDGRAVVVDEPWPWGNVLTAVQPGVHLAGHTEQLLALRRP
jgi:hypothetical protein